MRTAQSHPIAWKPIVVPFNKSVWALGISMSSSHHLGAIVLVIFEHFTLYHPIVYDITIKGKA